MTSANLPPMHERILQAIHDRKVHMKSRWRIAAFQALRLVGFGALTLLFVFLLSFFMYSVYQNGSAFLLLSGWSGMWTFLSTIPWLPALLGVCAALGFGILVSQQTRAYRFPVSYTLAGMAILLIAVSFAVTQTSIHPAIAGFASNHALPIVQPLYEALPKAETEAAVVGEVQDVQRTSITVQDRQGKTVSVQVDPQTSGDLTPSKVKKGDVLIFVEKKSSKPTAENRTRNEPEDEGEEAAEYEHVRVPSQKYQQQVRDEIAKKTQELQRERGEKSESLQFEEQDGEERPNDSERNGEETLPTANDEGQE